MCHSRVCLGLLISPLGLQGSFREEAIVPEVSPLCFQRLILRVFVYMIDPESKIRLRNHSRRNPESKIRPWDNSCRDPGSKIRLRSHSRRGPESKIRLRTIPVRIRNRIFDSGTIPVGIRSRKFDSGTIPDRIRGRKFDSGTIPVGIRGRKIDSGARQKLRGKSPPELLLSFLNTFGVQSLHFIIILFILFILLGSLVRKMVRNFMGPGSPIFCLTE